MGRLPRQIGLVEPDAPVLTACLVGQEANASTPREGEMQAYPVYGIGFGDIELTEPGVPCCGSNDSHQALSVPPVMLARESVS